MFFQSGWENKIEEKECGEIINTGLQKSSYGKLELKKLSKTYTCTVFFRDASSANMTFLSRWSYTWSHMGNTI